MTRTRKASNSNAHAAFADLFEQLVRPDASPDFAHGFLNLCRAGAFGIVGGGAVRGIGGGYEIGPGRAS